MKIVFLSDGAYAYASGAQTAVGGAERDQWLLGTSLARSGWLVSVGVRDGIEPGHREIINGVEFVGIDRGQILRAWYRFFCSESPDWCYWEGATHLLGPAVEIAKAKKIRTIFALGFDSEVEPRQALNYRRRWWRLYAWGLARTDRIFAQHEGQLSRLPAAWRVKASILPKVCILDGVIGDKVEVKSHQTRNYVAWVGMFRHHKRPDLLVDVARKMPITRFVVCGGPSSWMTPSGYSEQVMRQLHGMSNVDYLGQVSPERAMQVIADAAVLFSTSDEEGFPNTFTQAWSSGTPIVTLKVDPDGIIQRLGLGAVSGDLERAASDLSLLLNSPERRDEIALRARQLISDNYSAAAVVETFEGALSSHAPLKSLFLRGLSKVQHREVMLGRKTFRRVIKRNR